MKIKDYGSHLGMRYLGFTCPGCGHDHGVRVSEGPPYLNKDGFWGWNGSLTSPTFTPSVLCNANLPESRCHFFVKDGQIQYLSDCWHPLAGKTVDLPEWEA